MSKRYIPTKAVRSKEEAYLRLATKAYRELRSMNLNPRSFLPSIQFMAKRAEVNRLPDEAWLSQVRESAYDVMRERSAPYWGSK